MPLKTLGQLYWHGLRNMTIGKTLWKLVIIKLVIMFGILKVFFFSDYLDSRFDSDQAKADYVRQNLIGGH